MPWTPPSDPVSGTVITVAYAVANLLTQIRWLRLLSGNADPPGSAYVLTSDSVSAVTWKQHAAAILADLGYTPLNKAGDTMTGPLTVAQALTITQINDAGSGGRLVLTPSAGQVGAIVDLFNNVFRIFNPSDPTKMISFTLTNGTLALPGSLTLAALSATTTGRISGAASGSTAGYTIDADNSTFRIYNTSNPGFILAFGLATNVLTLGSATVITSATIGSQSVASAANAANAAQVGGRTPTATATADAIPIANASGKLDAWVTPSAGIPIGLGSWVPTAAEIPAGWARYTPLDGRMPVGAGTTFSVTFVENTNYGAAWDHAHSTPAHAHSGASLSINGSTGPASGSGNQANVSTPNPANAAQTHTHDQGSLDVAGSTDSDGASNTGSTAWAIPSRAVVWIRKS